MMSPILRHIDDTERSAVLLSGGYFQSPPGVDDFSLNTLALAARLGREVRKLHRGNKASYDVMHNDLGQACGTDTCSIGDNGQDGPVDVHSLRELAAAERITFTITRERTLRNRAARAMHKWLRDTGTNSLFRQEGEEIVYRSRQYDSVRVGVVKDFYVVPRCPLIMNEYYSRHFDRLRRAFPDCRRRYLIEIGSAVDKDKMFKGAEIYLRGPRSSGDQIIHVFTDSRCTELVEFAWTARDF
ncbi:hypothetical protein [Saccharopolyspora erythraea]|uniref:hypothetical protein n=1 Tax=Saccharopolyspora erythraea TaxID=1836 RepID=UPI00117AA896|nr:hypothetical protein [Saccharopolyspora erythraea]QRK92250.1 hypothetical protein JQX30_13515 [Saccharopolyspora erythraea]